MKLKQMVLITGAHRTMAAHIQSFERFEKWCSWASVQVFPLAIDRILKYCLFRDNQECGPSVLPSFRAGVKWVCARLAIDPPDFEDHTFVALQNRIIADGAKMLKEAVPVPIDVVIVKVLETLVIDVPVDLLVAEFSSGGFCVWCLLPFGSTTPSTYAQVSSR